MKRLLICVLILPLIAPLTVQAIPTFQVVQGCGPIPYVAGAMGQENFRAGCAALNQCLEQTGILKAGCEFPVYEALMALCEGDHCDLQSRVYMASLMIYLTPPETIWVMHHINEVLSMVPALNAFQAGDYQVVIDTFLEIEPEFRLGASPFLPYIVGLMYEQLGDPEAAALAYRASIDLYRMPFVTWQRAEVLIQLGYEDAAAAEAFMMGDYPQGEAILSAHPLPDDLKQEWFIYPVGYIANTHIGTFSSDFSMVPSLPVEMVFLSDDSILLVGAIGTFVPDRLQTASDVMLFYPVEDFFAQEALYNAASIHLTFEDQLGSISGVYEGGDSSTFETRLLITPADSNDPREGQDERCKDGARWRLTVGEYGAGQSFGETPSYYAAPDGELVGTFDDDHYQFQVIAGPMCVESQAWWEIQFVGDQTQTYWLPEARAQFSELLTGLPYYVYPSLPPSQ